MIDVCSPAEFETVHIADPYNVPLDLLGEHAAQLVTRLDAKMVLVCQSALTDSCMMGRVLSALPYNRRPGGHTAAEILDQLPQRQRTA